MSPADRWATERHRRRRTAPRGSRPLDISSVTVPNPESNEPAGQDPGAAHDGGHAGKSVKNRDMGIALGPRMAWRRHERTGRQGLGSEGQFTVITDEGWTV